MLTLSLLIKDESGALTSIVKEYFRARCIYVTDDLSQSRLLLAIAPLDEPILDTLESNRRFKDIYIFDPSISKHPLGIPVLHDLLEIDKMLRLHRRESEREES